LGKPEKALFRERHKSGDLPSNRAVTQYSGKREYAGSIWLFLTFPIFESFLLLKGEEK